MSHAPNHLKLLAAGFLGVLTIVTITGCSSPSRSALSPSSAASTTRAPTPKVVDQWVHKQGGLSTAHADQLRADAALDTLAPAMGDRRKPVRVFVLASDKVTAYVWPRGGIYVSRGLIQRLSEQELAAAIAHEMGHLIDTGTTHIATLEGATGSDDHEMLADAKGVQLLTRSGLNPAAMATMLQKVHDAQPENSPLRPRLQARIDALR